MTFLLVENRSRLIVVNEHQIVSDKRNWYLTVYETQKTWTSLESVSFSPSPFSSFSHLHCPGSPEAWLLARACVPQVPAEPD